MRLVTFNAISQRDKLVTIDIDTIGAIVAVDDEGKDYPRPNKKRTMTLVKTPNYEVYINKPYHEVLKILSSVLRFETLDFGVKQIQDDN